MVVKPSITIGVISGSQSVCGNLNSTSVTYSVAPITGVTSYTWSVTGGATVASGNGTNVIQVSYPQGFVNGVISVSVTTGCGVTTQTLSVSTTPLAVTAISGPNCVNAGSSYSYSVAPVSGATTYAWTAPSGASVVSGQGTNIVSINYLFNYAGTTSVTVVAKNNCSSTAPQTLMASIKPSTPSVIYGTSIVCSVINTTTTVTYSVDPTYGATSYLWAVPTGATIVSGQGTTSIQVKFGSTFIGGNIGIQSLSSCSSSPQVYFPVSKKPSSIGAISGLTNVCGIVGSTNSTTYSLSPISGITTYSWTSSVPTKVSVVSGQGSNIVNVTFATGYTTGTLSVTAVTSCGNSSASLVINSTTPAKPAAISGPVNVGSYLGSTSTVNYSVSAVAGANAYVWVLPSGVTVPSGITNTNSIDVTYTLGFTTGVIGVKAAGNCGTSPQATLAVNGLLARGSHKPSQVVVKGVTCYGLADGEVAINTENSDKKPLTYELNNGIAQQSNIFKGLAAGNYMVTIKTGQTAIEQVPFVINQPNKLETKVFVINNCTFQDSNDGYAVVSATGGIGTYNYICHETESKNQELTNLHVGRYSITVQDDNMCKASSEFTITSSGLKNIPFDFDSVNCVLYPNPASNELGISLKTSLENYLLTITSITGKIVFNEIYGQALIDDIKLNTSVWPTGYYFLKITGTNGKVLLTKQIMVYH